MTSARTLRVDLGVPLHPVEVDLLCAFAEVEAPFPLEIPASGSTEIERRSRYSDAREQLTARGLADENGPLGVAEDFVFLVRASTGVLDMVLGKEKPTLAAAILNYRDEALLVTQDLASAERMLHMKAVSMDDGLDDLMRLVPMMEAPLTAPFSLPRRALEDAFHEMIVNLPDPDPDDPDRIPEAPRLTSEQMDDLLRRHGIDDRVARRMVSHLQPVLGNGQVGLAKRDDSEDQWQRVGEELRWLDTERGRFRLAGDAEWMSVNPLPRDDIRSELRRLSAKTR